jgi:hypothetical protein
LVTGVPRAIPTFGITVNRTAPSPAGGDVFGGRKPASGSSVGWPGVGIDRHELPGHQSGGRVDPGADGHDEVLVGPQTTLPVYARTPGAGTRRRAGSRSARGRVLDGRAMGSGPLLRQLRDELVTRTYRALRNRRVAIPKEGGNRVPGIPAIRGRVVQGTLKLILGPIFEADFCEGSYGGFEGLL